MNVELVGVFLSLSASLFFAIRTLLIRKATVTGRPIDAVMVALGMGVLVLFPLSIILYWPSFNLSMKSISAFIGTGLLGNFFGLICYYEGIKRVGASRATSISMGRLLVATFLSLLILGENITMLHLIGIFILTFGISIVSWGLKAEYLNSVSRSMWDFLFPFSTILFFGLTTFLIKLGLSMGTPVFVGLAIHVSTGLIVLIGFSIVRGNSPLRVLKSNEKVLYGAAGIAYILALIFAWLGFSLTRVVVVYPFRSMSPMFVLVLSYIYLRRLERITKSLILGSILVVLGGSLIGIFM